MTTPARTPDTDVRRVIVRQPSAPSSAGHAVGFLRVSTVTGPPRALLLAGLGSRGAAPGLLLGTLASGRAELAHAGTVRPCPPGTVFLCDEAAEDPVELRAHEDFALHLVRVPRRALTLTDDQVRELTRRAPENGGTVAPVLAALAATVARSAGSYRPLTALHIAGAVAETVTALAEERPRPSAGPAEGDADGQRRLLGGRLRGHAAERLGDPHLTPAALAAAHHISLRQLHKLFEGSGTTVGRWIKDRRLEEARRELARPGREDIGVATVARRWGFASPGHFSRSFRAAYGMSPTEWRAARRPSDGPADADG